MNIERIKNTAETLTDQLMVQFNTRDGALVLTIALAGIIVNLPTEKDFEQYKQRTIESIQGLTFQGAENEINKIN